MQFLACKYYEHVDHIKASGIERHIHLYAISLRRVVVASWTWISVQTRSQRCCWGSSFPVGFIRSKAVASILPLTIRNVTKNFSEVNLFASGTAFMRATLEPPSGEQFPVHLLFKSGFQESLKLHADHNSRICSIVHSQLRGTPEFLSVRVWEVCKALPLHCVESYLYHPFALCIPICSIVVDSLFPAKKEGSTIVSILRLLFYNSNSSITCLVRRQTQIFPLLSTHLECWQTAWNTTGQWRVVRFNCFRLQFQLFCCWHKLMSRQLIW